MLMYALVGGSANTVPGFGLGAAELGLPLFLHSFGYANSGLFVVAHIVHTPYTQLVLLQVQAFLTATT